MAVGQDEVAPARVVTARLICRIFQAHLIDCDLPLAKAGSSIPARIAMMAMTTSNSISVKASRFALGLGLLIFFD